MPGRSSLYWAERTPERRRPRREAFRDDREADVVIIGGGLTGTSAAFVFANAGWRTVLLEADRIARGSTAAGAGVIVPEPDSSFADAERVCGRRVARAAWQAARQGALEFGAALERLSIRCDLSHAPVLINATTADAASSLRREQAARKAAGLEAPWLSPQAVAKEVGIESAGAIRIRDAFVFDPVKAALGLAQAAENKGAQIFERSAVTRTRFTRKYADVVLGSGTIRTRAVFVATGGPGALFGSLRRHVRESLGHVVVTDPWSAPMRRSAGARASIVTEAGERPHLWRWLPDGRALLAGGRVAVSRSARADKAIVRETAELMYELSVRYPAMSGLPVASGWQVPIVSTLDGLPWIGAHRNYPFHFFAVALGWHGDAWAWLAAKAALRAFSNESRPEDAAIGFGR